MRFVKTYWLEMLMVIPLFAYIMGFTLLPILTNIKESFIDQRFGRRYASFSKIGVLSKPFSIRWRLP